MELRYLVYDHGTLVAACRDRADQYRNCEGRFTQRPLYEVSAITALFFGL